MPFQHLFLQNLSPVFMRRNYSFYYKIKADTKKNPGRSSVLLTLEK